MSEVMRRKVLLLALSDDYWTPFVLDFADDLRARGFQPVIVFDSRIGEYQVFGKRVYQPNTPIYYFTDYLSAAPERSQCDVEAPRSVGIEAMFSDYFRLYCLGACSALAKTNWVRVKEAMYSFFEKIFRDENIAAVVHDQVSTSFSFVCWAVAQASGATYLGLVGARIPGRYEVRRSVYSEDDAVAAQYKQIVAETGANIDQERAWAKAYLADIDRMVPSYMTGNPLNVPALGLYANPAKLRSLVRKLKYHLVESRDAEWLMFRERPLQASLRSFRRNMARLRNKRLFRRYETKCSAEWLRSKRFLVYPLHYQPEASTSVGSPDFVDQLAFLRNVAFSLPENTFLVVKEHVSAIGFNGAAFYRDIACLPRVILLGPEWNIKELIRLSVGVVALTSTAAFESLLLGKPVFLFGSAFYQFHPLCRSMSSWKELRRALREPAPLIGDFDNEAFLIAYRRYTRPGAISYSERVWGIGPDLLEVVESELKRQDASLSLLV